jgi:SAM-dependent methyltransferase
MVKSVHYNDWYNQPEGSKVLAIEQTVLNDLPVKLFGRYILQLGGSNNIDLLRMTNIQKQVYFNPDLENLPADCGYSICGDFNELPFLPGSIDAAVLFHVLEFTKRPGDVLCELFDVLVPEGYAIIFVFSPYNLFQLLRFLGRPTHPWSMHCLKARQLKRWLLDLNFSIISYQNLFFSTFTKFHEFFWPTLGGVYMFLVQKKLGALIPVRPKKLKQLSPIPVKAYVEPTVRS